MNTKMYENSFEEDDFFIYLFPNKKTLLKI